MFIHCVYNVEHQVSANLQGYDSPYFLKEGFRGDGWQKLNLLRKMTIRYIFVTDLNGKLDAIPDKRLKFISNLFHGKELYLVCIEIRHLAILHNNLNEQCLYLKCWEHFQNLLQPFRH